VFKFDMNTVFQTFVACVLSSVQEITVHVGTQDINNTEIHGLKQWHRRFSKFGYDAYNVVKSCVPQSGEYLGYLAPCVVCWGREVWDKWRRSCGERAGNAQEELREGVMVNL